MIGQTISHYRITSHLGSGGMGVVYAGEDVRLGRPVALKFVPEELAKEPQALDRLRAEARAASTLNHPSICTVYDVGEYEGRPYIVMELLKGQTLRDSLGEGRLKIHNVVDIGIQVADALDAAHARGILHRDINPANLFLVERGVVKILDFGLAKQLAQPGPSTTTAGLRPELVTAQGVTVGTVSYMSPEQVTGEQLDGRTDLFSLGIVLYECATGHRPFTGKTSAVILSAILNQSPVAPTVLNPQIPVHLQDVINNCLEKDRELRYQDAAGLRADLKRIRRDLESGHSKTLSAVAVSNAELGSTSNRSRSVPVLAATGTQSHRMAPLAWGAGFAALVVVALLSYWYWGRPPAPATPAAGGLENSRLEMASSSLAAGNYRDALGRAADVLRLTPDNVEARRVRDEARAAIDRFDEAIARGNRLVASGDTDGASAALRAARAIDPNGPAVADLSDRIVASYRTQADLARQRAEPPRPSGTSTPARPAPSEHRVTETQRPVSPTREPTPAPPVTAPLPEPSPAVPASAAAPVQPPRAPQIQEAPVSQAPAPVATDRTAPPPQGQAEPPSAPAISSSASRDTSAAKRPSAEEDEAVIRRVLDSWARAIETKDLALYRSVKPNLSPAEQRRLEEGFRAGSSQRVVITVLRIDRHVQGQALVYLRRRDTLTADGRQQTSDIQQTVTMARSGAGWVISEIGR